MKMELWPNVTFFAPITFAELMAVAIHMKARIVHNAMRKTNQLVSYAIQVMPFLPPLMMK